MIDSLDPVMTPDRDANDCCMVHGAGVGVEDAPMAVLRNASNVGSNTWDSDPRIMSDMPL